LAFRSSQQQRLRLWCKTLHGRTQNGTLSHCGRALALFLCISPDALTQDRRPTEPQVKAAYLFNFGKFMTRDKDFIRTNSFEICILGKDPFGPVLDATVAGESIDERAVAVKRLSNVVEAAPCSVVFMSSSESGRVESELRAMQHMSLLTVSDVPHFAERGGTIGLVTQAGRIRFEVNRASAEEHHLVLSSELLKLATKVIGTSMRTK
jgi:hypothetical protein